MRGPPLDPDLSAKISSFVLIALASEGQKIMTDPSVSPASAMEGKGAYSQHSRIPAAGGALAVPLLAEAARRIPLDGSGRPIVIADYGSSDGRNSFAPMNAAIEELRKRAEPERPIEVYHTDLPGNDFATLFGLVERDPDSYARRHRQVYSFAVERSFYQGLFPARSVDLGWSSYAAVWLSELPTQIPDHIFIPRTSAEIRAQFDRQAAKDWKTFLTLRADELRPGGRLVVVLPSLDQAGSTGYGPLWDCANEALSDLVAAGFVSREERGRMTLASCPRRERDLLEPFAERGVFEDMTVEHVATVPGADTAWNEYETDHDAEALAAKRAMFFRVIFAPSVAQGLSPDRPAEDKRELVDRLEAGVRRRLSDAPMPIHHLVGMIALAKTNA